jgi:hypothetical protein
MDYFRRYDTMADQLRDLRVEPPRKAQIDYAISAIDFYPHPDTGHEMIAYKIDHLKEWYREFMSWLGNLSR